MSISYFTCRSGYAPLFYALIARAATNTSPHPITFHTICFAVLILVSIKCDMDEKNSFFGHLLNFRFMYIFIVHCTVKLILKYSRISFEPSLYPYNIIFLFNKMKIDTQLFFLLRNALNKYEWNETQEAHCNMSTFN